MSGQLVNLNESQETHKATSILAQGSCNLRRRLSTLTTKVSFYQVLIIPIMNHHYIAISSLQNLFSYPSLPLGHSSSQHGCFCIHSSMNFSTLSSAFHQSLPDQQGQFTRVQSITRSTGSNSLISLHLLDVICTSTRT